MIGEEKIAENPRTGFCASSGDWPVFMEPYVHSDPGAKHVSGEDWEDVVSSQ